jgi:hypothetical protein
VVIDQVFVPAPYTCSFGPGMKRQCTYYQSPVYRYVLYASFALPIGAVALGIAQGAIDAGLELAQSMAPGGRTELLREQPMFQVRLAEAVALVRSARAWLHTVVQQTWESLLAVGEVSFDARRAAPCGGQRDAQCGLSGGHYLHHRRGLGELPA